MCFIKNTLAKNIIGVEINPVGHKYGLKNIERNKLSNVKLFCGDVKEIVPTLNSKFDRIIMPLPKTAEEFLSLALSVVKKEGMIHLYGFFDEAKFEEAKQNVLKICVEKGFNCEIKDFVLCGQHAPRSYRVCFDIKVR